MKDYFAVILLAYFMATTANVVNSFSYNINHSAGPCSKKFEQQLAEIKEEIRAIRNATGW